MDDLSCFRLRNVLSCILEGVVRNGDKTVESQPVTRFTALAAPNISIRDYMERIYKYSKCSVECLVLGLIYIDRFIQSSGIQVNSLTVHRVLLTSVVIAAKTFDDDFYTNTHYARVGGIPPEELALLEMDFLFNIHFSLYVSCEDYQRYYEEIYKHATMYCNQCKGMDLPRLTWKSRSNEGSCLQYGKGLGIRDDSPTNVNFNASDY
ncbi:cyclin-U4-1 [Blastocystis sp. ATCC 50177/Nand II]|uniref:Cyclin-U4-1 n=1 Tax=Blastocystis sp. subtype 1 (strain ATCC 50177 / NandII) TaxID=478820 RepID=A0A196S4T9_BLAHN|nr:cyclin-U4-1 [Blastocystis sp. ATCC 50177/Nand II]